MEFVLSLALGKQVSFTEKAATLQSVASALNAGDLARAIMVTQFMRLPSLPNENAFQRALAADSLAKAGFNPDQPRDSHGQWTTGDAGASSDRTPAHERNTSGFQNAATTICTNCHAVVPPVPPPWQGPFDDFLFGPQLIRPNNPADHGYNEALAECYQICTERFAQGTLVGPNRGPEAPTSYRKCMRECLGERGYENY